MLRVKQVAETRNAANQGSEPNWDRGKSPEEERIARYRDDMRRLEEEKAKLLYQNTLLTEKLLAVQRRLFELEEAMRSRSTEPLGGRAVATQKLTKELIADHGGTEVLFKQYVLVRISRLLSSCVNGPDSPLFASLSNFYVSTSFRPIVTNCRSYNPPFLLREVYHGFWSTMETFVIEMWRLSSPLGSTRGAGMLESPK